MSDSKAATRPLSMLALVVQGVFLAVVVVLGQRCFGSILHGLALAIVAVILLRWGRSLALASHRAGYRLLRAGKFAEAADAFDEGFRFFTRWRILDDLRALALFSPSSMGYREVALVNLAYCRIQAGQRERAKEVYDQLLAEYPNNRMASVALKRLRDVAKGDDVGSNAT